MKEKREQNGHGSCPSNREKSDKESLDFKSV